MWWRMCLLIAELTRAYFQFVTFADPNAAATFFQQATGHGLMIHNAKVKISWGRSVSNLSPAVLASITAGATRNVYIGSIDDLEKYNEEKLRQDLGEFGGQLRSKSSSSTEPSCSSPVSPSLCLIQRSSRSISSLPKRRLSSTCQLSTEKRHRKRISVDLLSSQLRCRQRFQGH